MKELFHDFLSKYSQIDFGGGSKDSVLVAGTGRGGTTWLAEVLARSLNARLIFEPFLHDPARSLLLAKARCRGPLIRTNRQPYISPDLPHSERYDSAIQKILKGRVRHLHTERGRRGIYFRRVVKAIRANLMLGYIARRFPEIKIILLVRDPVSVVTSQLRVRSQGAEFNWLPDYVLDQKELVRARLYRYRSLIHDSNTLTERLATAWCIETLIATEDLRDVPNAVIVQYEKLQSCDEPWDRMKHLLRHLHFVPTADILRVPSQTAWAESDSNCEVVQLGGSDYGRVESIVDKFGLSQFLCCQ